MKAELKDRLRTALDIREMKQSELVEKAKVDKGQLSSWLSGKYLPRQKNISRVAEALHVDEAWLMGFDVPMERPDTPPYIQSPPKVSNIIPVPETKKIPLLGTIACGEPILAEENVSDYINMDNSIHADFALKCKGDSMINARIFDGDIVYIRKQSDVENGEIAAVLINNLETEATLKRVYKTDSSIRLCAANPTYADMVYEKEAMNDVTIIGKAVAFLSAVR